MAKKSALSLAVGTVNSVLTAPPVVAVAEVSALRHSSRTDERAGTTDIQSSLPFPSPAADHCPKSLLLNNLGRLEADVC